MDISKIVKDKSAAHQLGYWCRGTNLEYVLKKAEKYKVFSKDEVHQIERVAALMNSCVDKIEKAVGRE